MPGPVVHVGAVATCPHGGSLTIVSSNSRVLVSGMQVATVADTFVVAGCAFTVPPGKPQPCVSARFTVPAARVKVLGQPVILQSSVGICQSAEQIPQGPPLIASTQVRVNAT
jgi:hypothetical protein